MMIQQDRLTKSNHHFLKLAPHSGHVVFHAPHTPKRDYKGILDRLALRIDSRPPKAR